MPIMLFVILALIFVILLIVVTNIVIVPQSMVYVVERLGSYSDTWSAGLHVKIPFIERIAKKVSLKEQVADFPPQPVITRDMRMPSSTPTVSTSPSQPSRAFPPPPCATSSVRWSWITP